MNVSHPLRIDAEKAGVVAPAVEPYPAPEVTSRDDVPAGVAWPGPVTALRAYGEGLGWYAVVQYSRGCMPYATNGRPGRVKDWYTVRFYRPPRAAYAVHDGKTWADICVWGADLSPFKECGVTELKQWLDGVTNAPTWCREIHARRVEQAAVAARRLKAAPRKARVSEGL